MHHLFRRPLRVLLVFVLAVAVAAAGAPAGAQSDAKAQRDEVQRKRAALAADIDVLRATDAQVEAALRALQGNVAARTADLRDAERRAASAQVALETATDQVESKQAEIAVLDQAAKDVVVAAYMQPTASAGILDALATSSIGEAELKQALLEARSSDQFDVLDQLERARDDLEVARAEAESAAVEAREQQAAVGNQLEEVQQATSQQEAVVAEVQDRLDHRLSEAQSLAELDRELAAQIEEEQRRLAAELQRQQQAREQAEAAAAARAAAATRTASESRSSAPRPAPAAPAPAAPSPPRTVPITGSGSIVSVRGIRVHNTIASSLADMLGAADAAGISLSGGGYRDPAGQIAVRRNNCGTSNYAIYEMPASSCRPPTARPGTSMHERGLAIDFTYGGRIISSRSSAAFQWLNANASRYGFYNLPSEPWHWSVNGR
ncbi:MAG TPA: D-alanyl-D-alanine carboxypeptidase family protein [Acidimicrobiales bacterium]|nr:D-alanyl-D-alanine carboxypeptidase family protein [Acidimicrobiales bacterium]